MKDLKKFIKTTIREFLNENNNGVLESDSKKIFNEFGLDWFIIENELPTPYSYIFLNPVGGYRTIVFDFGYEYTQIKEEDKNNIDFLYEKVKKIITKYNLFILEDIKEKNSFFIECRLQGEENITNLIENYDKIYHVTLDKYIPSILENGLKTTIKSPDLKNYSYEYNKLHFTTNPFNKYEKDLLFNFIMGQKDKNNKPILIEINTNGLNNSFYLDKDAWQSPDEDVYNFWSNSNVPKENIKIIG